MAITEDYGTEAIDDDDSPDTMKSLEVEQFLGYIDKGAPKSGDNPYTLGPHGNPYQAPSNFQPQKESAAQFVKGQLKSLKNEMGAHIEKQVDKFELPHVGDPLRAFAKQLREELKPIEDEYLGYIYTSSSNKETSRALGYVKARLPLDQEFKRYYARYTDSCLLFTHSIEVNDPVATYVLYHSSVEAATLPVEGSAQLVFLIKHEFDSDTLIILLEEQKDFFKQHY